MATTRRVSVAPELAIDAAATASGIEAFIAARAADYRRDGAVLGLSGGLDSAVVAALAARALGPHKVLGLILPERDTPSASAQDAQSVASHLRIRGEIVDLTPPLEAMGVYGRLPRDLLEPTTLQAALPRQPGLSLFRVFLESSGHPSIFSRKLIAGVRAYVNVKHRLRMVYWYYRGEAENLLVLGGVNRTEWLAGFFVEYGDGAADVAPLGRLYKTQVFQLGHFLQLPETVLAKAPAPDLLPGITDEYALGLTYEVLDRILLRLERGTPQQAIAQELGLEPAWVEYAAAVRKASQPMRKPPEMGPAPTPARGQPTAAR